MHRLPLSQGVEMEVQVVDEKGRLLCGTPLVRVWSQMMENALKNLRSAVKDAPSEIVEKVLNISFREKEKRGRRLPYVVISYKTVHGAVEVDAFGPDPNVSQITWILELVTPPCEFMEELEWWIKTLFTVAHSSLPSGCHLISIGFNPLEEEYRSGVSFSDHYHIGGMQRRDIPVVYNMIRAFIPHLIALTVNSPFIKGGVTGIVRVQRRGKTVIVGKNCVRSIRLKENTNQLGPADRNHYIPYLETLDRKFFDKVVMREPPDDRYVDAFPFTDYGTIEIRVFDSQFSIARRLAIVAILQALALKAIKLSGKGGGPPKVDSGVLVENREKAILYGLLGKFFPDRRLGKAHSIYNAPPSGKQYSKLFEAVQGMLNYVKEELDELNFWEYLKPILVSVYGSRRLQPPCAPADYLLYLYDSSGGNMESVVRSLFEITRKYCTGHGDPVLEAFGDAGMEVAVEAVQETAPIKVSMKTETTASKVVAGETIPFTVEVVGSDDVEATLIGKVVLAERDEVLQSNIKKLNIRKGVSIRVTGSQLPLTVPFKAFQGVKDCFLKFTLKSNGLVYETVTRRFRALATPIVKITPQPLPKTITKGEKKEFNVKIESETPEFKGAYQVVLLMEKEGKTKPFFVKKTQLPASITATIPLSGEGQYTIRVQVAYLGELVADYKTAPISVEKPAETKKPVKVKTEKQARVKLTEPLKVKNATSPEEVVRVKVVTRLTPPPKTQVVKPQLQAVLPEEATVTRPAGTAKSSHPARPLDSIRQRAKSVKAHRSAKTAKPVRRPTTRTTLRDKREKEVKVSRAIDTLSVSLRPRVSVSSKVSSPIVQWGKACRVVFEIKNLNSEVTGPFWVRILLINSGSKQLDHREITIYGSKKLAYKVRVGRDVEAGSFKVRCEVFHNGVIIAQEETRNVEVVPLPTRKTVKVLEVEKPRATTSTGIMVFRIKLEIKGTVKPVEVYIMATTPKNTSSQKYSLINGRYILPITISVGDVQSDEATVNLKVKVGEVKIYEKKLTVPVLLNPPVKIQAVTIRKATIEAGSKLNYSIKLHNTTRESIKVRGEVRMCSLTGEEKKEKFTATIKPSGIKEVHGEIEVPPWLVGEKVYLLTTLNYKKNGNSFLQQEATRIESVAPPLKPLVKIRGSAPKMAKEGEKVKLNLLVEKRTEKPVKVRLIAESPVGIKEIWSGKIKDEKKAVKAMWSVPSIPYAMEFNLKAEVDIDGKRLPPNLTETLSRKMTVEKRAR